jgi:hypothetical protein
MISTTSDNPPIMERHLSNRLLSGVKTSIYTEGNASGYREDITATERRSGGKDGIIVCKAG